MFTGLRLKLRHPRFSLGHGLGYCLSLALLVSFQLLLPVVVVIDPKP